MFELECVVTDLFEDRTNADHFVENVEHPERIHQDQDGNQQGADRLLRQQLRGDVVRRDTGGHVQGPECIQEEREEDNDEDKLKEEDVEMTQHPARAEIVEIPDLRHEIVEFHILVLLLLPILMKI